MSNLKFITEVEDSNYMTLVVEDDQLDEVQLTGFIEAELKPFLHINKKFRDGITKLYYNTCSYQTLQDFITISKRNKKGLAVEDIAKILKSITHVHNVLNNYFFLNKNNVALSIDNIYIHMSTIETKYMYIPFYQEIGSFHDGLMGLFSELKYATEDDEKTLVFISKLDRYFRSEEFQIDNLSNYIDRLLQVNKNINSSINNNINNEVENNRTSHESIQKGYTPKQIPKNQEQFKQPQPKQLKLNSTKSGNYKKTMTTNTDKKNNTNQKKNKTNFLLLQVLLIVIIGAIASTGMLVDDTGNMKLDNIIVIGIIILAVDVLLYRKLMNGNQSNQIVTNKTMKQIKQKKQQSRSRQQQPNQDMPQVVTDKYSFDSSQHDNEGTVILDNSNRDDSGHETVVLSHENYAYILYEDNNQRRKVMINKKHFFIGRAEDMTDLSLDNNTISSIHAEIITDNNQYYIQDKNSKNHTYANNQLLNPNEKVELIDGMNFRLSNQDFTFRVE